VQSVATGLWRITIYSDMTDDPRVKAAEVNIILLQERLTAIEGAPKNLDQWLATSLLKSAHRAYIHLRHG
jgi:hypothetical protein